MCKVVNERSRACWEARAQMAGPHGRAVEQSKTSLFSVQGEALKTSQPEGKTSFGFVSFLFFSFFFFLAALGLSCSMQDL